MIALAESFAGILHRGLGRIIRNSVCDRASVAA